MRNVMNHQNITHYPIVLELIRKSEQLFQNIQTMDSVMPLQDDERLFIDAIRDMNYQASRMQAEESQESHPHAPTATTTTSTNTVPPSQSTDVSAKSSPASSSSEPVVVVVVAQEDQQTHVVVTASSPSTLIHEQPIDPVPIAASSLSTATVSPPQSVVSSSAVTTVNTTTTTTAPHVASSINTNTSSNSTQQLSDRLDHATMLAVEAAVRLNCHNAPPDVPLALSWMHRVAGNKADAKRDPVVAPNGTQPLKGHLPTSSSPPSSSSSSNLEAPTASLRRPLSAVDDPSASDAGSHSDVHPDPKRLRTI